MRVSTHVHHSHTTHTNTHTHTHTLSLTHTHTLSNAHIHKLSHTQMHTEREKGGMIPPVKKKRCYGRKQPLPSLPPYPSYNRGMHSMQRPRSGELRTQKLKSHLVRTRSLNVLPLKPGVGQYIAIHATLTAREFFFAYFYLPVHSPAFFPRTSPNFFLCWPAE